MEKEQRNRQNQGKNKKYPSHEFLKLCLMIEMKIIHRLMIKKKIFKSGDRKGIYVESVFTLHWKW